MPKPMAMYCVTFGPQDHPGKWVVRRWNIYPGYAVPDKEPHLVADSHADVQAYRHQHGAILLAPHPADDPVIREVWV